MTSEIVDPMNTASSIKDLCDTYGIDSADYVYDKFGNTVQLIDPLFAFKAGTDEHTLVKPRFGPPKSYQHALAKEKEGLAKSSDSWVVLRDLNRVTFDFEDPLMLTLAYRALLEKYKVSGLKNKFEDIYTTTYSQPPDIHMNLDLDGDGWLVEVQLMLASVLTIKKELHKFYDIVRAHEPMIVLAPLFSDAKTIVNTKDEEIENLYKILEDVKNADMMNMRLSEADGGEGRLELEAENTSLKSENERLRAMLDEVHNITRL
ncbi:hypothetical protein TL16_g10120 [Triparma laevis f. inornata]|uniref:Uncharacterized protein n=1 Tax=Triparma laevis f. inornata TaxID=1714386 RepID=A0A9W7BEA4_9STRA|nr:hypothetical protein TL16_g10120 [Triparma laevis f. inornata]